MPPGTAWHPPDISTHALREEGDGQGGKHADGGTYFYPRPPRGGRRGPFPRRIGRGRISTHALREEGDGVCEPGAGGHPHFYPRPPRGGRPATISGSTGIARFLPTPSARRATGERPRRTVIEWRFLPTPSARRATTQNNKQAAEAFISTHALREEGDAGSDENPRQSKNFYPRPPRGGRPRYASALRAALL